MKPELEEKLNKKFPDIFPEKSFGSSGYPDKPRIIKFHCSCGDGWFELIYDMCKKIKSITKLKGVVVAQQVKEKFGGLRFYVSYNKSIIDDENKYKKIQNVIDAAESKSYKVCEQCGKPGKLREDLGWIRTLCDACRTEIDIKDIIE